MNKSLVFAAVLLHASALVAASAPDGYVRQYVDTFERQETCSNPGNDGLGPEWDEGGAGGEPCIDATEQRAALPQGSWATLEAPGFTGARAQADRAVLGAWQAHFAVQR